jgi:hypothetical protein
MRIARGGRSSRFNTALSVSARRFCRDPSRSVWPHVWRVLGEITESPGFLPTGRHFTSPAGSCPRDRHRRPGQKKKPGAGTSNNRASLNRGRPLKESSLSRCLVHSQKERASSVAYRPASSSPITPAGTWPRSGPQSAVPPSPAKAGSGSSLRGGGSGCTGIPFALERR